MCYSLILTKNCEENSIVVTDTYESIGVHGLMGNGRINMYITFRTLKPLEYGSEIKIFFPFKSKIEGCNIVQKKEESNIIAYQMEQISKARGRCLQGSPDRSYIINFSKKLVEDINEHYGSVNSDELPKTLLDDIQGKNSEETTIIKNCIHIMEPKQFRKNNVIRLNVRECGIPKGKVFTLKLMIPKSMASHSWWRPSEFSATVLSYPWNIPGERGWCVINDREEEDWRNLEANEKEVVHVLFYFIQIYLQKKFMIKGDHSPLNLGGWTGGIFTNPDSDGSNIEYNNLLEVVFCDLGRVPSYSSTLTLRNIVLEWAYAAYMAVAIFVTLFGALVLVQRFL